jgi:hypothetical protein
MFSGLSALKLTSFQLFVKGTVRHLWDATKSRYTCFQAMARFGLVGVSVGILLGLLMTAQLFLETYNFGFGIDHDSEEGRVSAVFGDDVFLLGAGRADITG